MNIYDGKNFYTTSSKQINFSNEKLRYDNVNLIDMHNFFKSGSKRVKFINELESRHNTTFLNLDAHFHSSSKQTKFYNNLDSYPITDLLYFNQSKSSSIINSGDSDYVGFTNEVYKNNVVSIPNKLLPNGNPSNKTTSSISLNNYLM